MMLTGFPLKQFKINKLDEEGNKTPIWVSHDLLPSYLNSPCDTYEITEESRMTYATPAWLPKEENPNGTILLLDDFTRATSQFMQATMELINEGTYIGWSLPKYTNIILSSNPDNGMYNVTSLDSAAQSRFINFNVEFDIDLWAKWAEANNMEDRAINFALYYADELFKTDGVSAINARNYTMFCNSISSINDWDKRENSAQILTIAKGCFNDENNVLGKLFTLFIQNKLDKLISAKSLVTGDWATISTEAKNSVYSNGSYRADIANVLSTRFINYAITQFETKGVKDSIICDRLIDFANEHKNDDNPAKKEPRPIFTNDILFAITKTLVSKYPAKTTKLMMNPILRKCLL